MLLTHRGKYLFLVLDFCLTPKAENFLYSVVSTIFDRISLVFVKKKVLKTALFVGNPAPRIFSDVLGPTSHRFVLLRVRKLVIVLKF